MTAALSGCGKKKTEVDRLADDAKDVVLPDIRGLHPYYVALAERFAEFGLPPRIET